MPSVVISLSISASDSNQKDFEFRFSETDNTFLENVSQRFKINNGVSDFPMLSAQVNRAAVLFVVAESDDLELKFTTAAGASQKLKLKANKPVLIHSNDDFVGIFLTNVTASPIRGRFFAAGAE